MRQKHGRKLISWVLALAILLSLVSFGGISALADAGETVTPAVEETVTPAEEETATPAEEEACTLAEEGEITALDTSLLDGQVAYGSKTDATYGTYTYVNVTGLTPYVFMPTGAGSDNSSDFTNTTGMMNTYGEENDIVVAINAGIFYNAGTATQYCFNYKEPDGVVICDGVVMKSTESIDHTECDILVIDAQGNVGWTDYDVDADALAAGEAYYYNIYGQEVTQTEDTRIVSAVTGFVPILINSSVVYDAADTSLYGYHNFVGHYTQAAARQIFGVKADGSYGILTNTTKNDSGDTTAGWTLETAALAAKAEGFVFAYNFDGGGSTETVIGDDSSGTYTVNTICPQPKGTRPLPTYIVFTASNDAPASTQADSESLSAGASGTVLTGTALADITQSITVTESFENANGNTSTRTLYSKQGVDFDTTSTLTHKVVDKVGTVRKTSTSPNGTLYYTKTASETATCLNSNNNTYQDANYYDYSTGYTLSTADDLNTAGTKTITVSYGDLTTDAQVNMIDQPDHIGAAVNSPEDTFPIRTDNTNLDDIKEKLAVTAYAGAEDTTGAVLGDGDYTLSATADMSVPGTVTLNVDAFGVSTTIDVTLAAFEGYANGYGPAVSGTNISFVSDETSAMLLTTDSSGLNPTGNVASGIYYAPTIPADAASITVTPADGYSVELFLLRASSSNNYVVYDSGWETTQASAKTTGYSKVPAYYTIAVKTADGSDIIGDASAYCYVSYGSYNGEDVIYGTMTNTNGTYTYVNVSGLTPYVFMPTGAGSTDSSDFTNTTGMMNAYGEANDILVAINAGIFYNAGTETQYCFNYKEPDGVVISNGVVLKSTETIDHTECETLVFDAQGNVGWTDYYVDADALAAGTAYYYNIYGDKVDQTAATRIVSAVTGFVPILVNSEVVYDAADTSLYGYDNFVGHYTSAATRQIFGVKSDGSYGILTNTTGWTLEKAALTAQAEGFVFAYNLDGGGSAETVLGYDVSGTYTVDAIFPQAKGTRPLPTYIVFTADNEAPVSATASSVSAEVGSIGKISTDMALADLTDYLTVTESFTNANAETSTRTLYSMQGLDTGETLTHSVVDSSGTVRKTSESPNGTLYYTKTASEIATCLGSNNNTREDAGYYDYSTGYTLSTADDLTTAGTKTITVSYGVLTTDVQVDVIDAADHISAAVQTTGGGPRPSAYTFPVRADNTDLDDIKEKLTVTAYASAEDTAGSVLNAADYILSTADDMTEAGTVTMTVDYGGVTIAVNVTLVIGEDYINNFAPSLTTATMGPPITTFSIVSDTTTAMLLTNDPSGYNPSANAAAADGAVDDYIYYVPVLPDNVSTITVTPADGYCAEVILLKTPGWDSPLVYNSDWSTSEISVNMSDYSSTEFYTIAVKPSDGTTDISGAAASYLDVSIVYSNDEHVTYGTKTDDSYGTYTYVDVSGLTPYVFMPTGAGSSDSSDFTNTTGMMNAYGEDNDIVVAINAGIFYNAGTETQYCFNYKEPDGVVICDGVVLKSTESLDHTECDILVIDEAGNVGWTDYCVDADALAAGTAYYYDIYGNKVIQSETENSKIVSAVTGFVPILINSSVVYDAADTSMYGYDNFVGHYTQAATRQIFGVKADGTYGILTNTTGWTLETAALAAKAEGFIFAYNFDGGGSAETVVGYDDSGTYTVDAIFAQAKGTRPLPTYMVFTADNSAPESAEAASISASISGSTYKKGVTLADLTENLTVTESFKNANGNTSTRTLYSIQGVDTTKTLTHTVVDSDGTVRKTSTSPNGTLYYTKTASDESTCLRSNNNTRGDSSYYDYSTGYTLSTTDNLKISGTKTITVSYVPGNSLAALETTFTISIPSSDDSDDSVSTGGVTTPAAEETPFNDVSEDDWYYAYVQEAYEKGYMQGTSDNDFDPDGQMTRAMVITVLYRLAGEPATDGTSADTSLTQDWYKDAVSWAYGEDIAKGTGDNTFGPDLSITREQLVVFLYRYAQAQGMDTSYASGTKALDYDDWQTVPPYAQDAMRWAVESGIIEGMTESNIAPQGTATRAQFAAILSRFDSLVNA